MKLPKFPSKYILLTKLYVSSIFVIEFERGMEETVQKKIFANKKIRKKNLQWGQTNPNRKYKTMIVGA